ncbi:hypothetical protein [Marinobacter sp. V034]
MSSTGVLPVMPSMPKTCPMVCRPAAGGNDGDSDEHNGDTVIVD